ncbi:alpha/beta hydrolase family protein [Pseudomonas anguilliseptica]|uniref:Prolyl oligopeptidase family protein n=1 Tax=Pseudomonas anguilliseptica TaxID=53406 RepID=A0A1H5C8R2_PSEAG|nr:alpha/beta fold hydrolase [Pseudomonas anguilliseptica]SED63162.1 Prolyl oligopeptidase family protein [Pseudomonas anguilliseptica]
MKHAAYRLFKKPFFGRFVRPWRWPTEAEPSQWQTMRIPSASGASLAALLAPAHGLPAKGAVLMCHPMGVVAKGFWIKYGHAELLRQANYHVMLFDLNGFGESSSSTMDFHLDVLAAGQALQAAYPQLPVAVLGASMGAAMSLCAMTDETHPFKAAVLEAAFPTLLHFWSRYPIPRMGIQLSKLVYPAGERRLRPLHAAEQLQGSPALLLIYGEADEFTPVHDGQLLWQALRGRTTTRFWQVPEARHTHAYAAAPEGYAQQVISFLDEQLGGRQQVA